MSARDRLPGLASLAMAVRDARLADLQAASAGRAAAEARMAALPLGPPIFGPTPEDAVAAMTLAAARARWLERERIRCNAELARAHVLEQAARAQAARAFGRADALRRLAARQGKG